MALTLCGLFAGQAQAQKQRYYLANGTSADVNEHSVCNKVTNNSGAPIYVPTATSGEWSTFRSSPPSGVTIGTCNSCGGNVTSGFSGYGVANGTSANICEHGTCRTVTNNTGSSLYIPTSSSAEWSGFISSPPASTTVGTCAGCTVGPSGTPGYTTTFICTNQNNVNMFTAAGSPGAVGNYEIVIASGVTISSTSASTASIITGNFAAGSNLRLTNYGNIYGRGGNGGSSSTAAQSGGAAVSMSRNLTINNASGKIYGGGGGGGRGAIGICTGPGTPQIVGGTYSGGGGGGQGSQNSTGGTGYQNGTAGTTASPGTGGNGGTPPFGSCQTYYSPSPGGKGGNGGAWGTAGSDGEDKYYSGAVGGAAGNSVQRNANTLTWDTMGDVIGTVN